MQAEIVTGDFLDVAKALEDGKFKLIMSSPPYNIGKAYESRKPLDAYLEWQRRVVAELPRLLRDDGSVVWQTGNYVSGGEVFPLDMYFYRIFKDYGFKLRNRVIWHFGHGLHCRKRFSGRYETLLWFTKTDSYTFNLDDVRIPSKYPGKRHYKGPKKGQLSGNPLGKNPSDVWEFLSEEMASGIIEVPNVKNNHPEKTAHPCQYPVELAERCVLACTNDGDWVLDPFGGAGTTMIAAVKQGRRAVTVDIKSEYSELAKQRLRQLENGTLGMRPLGKEIFQPEGRKSA